MPGDLVGYDLTIWASKCETFDELRPRLKSIFKKWACQKEKGVENGAIHWQIRGHLHTKRSIDYVIKNFADVSCNGHWSPTSKGTHGKSDFNYVLKADTRVEGPWTDQDVPKERPPLTRQLQAFLEQEPYPWQSWLRAEVQHLDDRSIKVVFDPIGNNGKSICAEWLEYDGLAYEIPPMTLMEDIMQCCMGTDAQPAYLVDMPRAMKKDKLAGFYSGLEALKNGVMYDKRYSFKKRRIDRPQVIVFTNVLPDFTLMSPDRWEVWCMQSDHSVQRMPWCDLEPTAKRQRMLEPEPVPDVTHAASVSSVPWPMGPRERPVHPDVDKPRPNVPLADGYAWKLSLQYGWQQVPVLPATISPTQPFQCTLGTGWHARDTVVLDSSDGES